MREHAVLEVRRLPDPIGEVAATWLGFFAGTLMRHVGYLIAVLASGILAVRIGSRRMVVGALLLATLLAAELNRHPTVVSALAGAVETAHKASDAARTAARPMTDSFPGALRFPNPVASPR